jgi:hypothetical protein
LRSKSTQSTLKQTGFLYAIISPIIIPFQALIFGLFWITYSKSSILLTEQDCGGLFYPKALKHLLTGLYMMQVCLIALFLLVRDSQGKAKCIGQACIMMFATGLTVVYHHLLCRAFDPLLSFSPTALKDTLAKDSALSPPFLHKALASSPTISIPRDDHRISSARALQLKEELKGVHISDTDATITRSGKICLR